MKPLQQIRQEMAEKGIELTPKQITWAVKKISKIHRILSRSPELVYLSPEEKQAMRQQFAEDGYEVTPAEFDDLIDIGIKIQGLNI